MIEKYRIIGKNIYNFDKKRFIIRVEIIFIQIIGLKKIKSKEIIGANYNRNKKWILLLAAIYIIPMKFAPFLIYYRELKNLRYIYIEKIIHNYTKAAF